MTDDNNDNNDDNDGQNRLLNPARAYAARGKNALRSLYMYDVSPPDPTPNLKHSKGWVEGLRMRLTLNKCGCLESLEWNGGYWNGMVELQDSGAHVHFYQLGLTLIHVPGPVMKLKKAWPWE